LRATLLAKVLSAQLAEVIFEFLLTLLRVDDRVITEGEQNAGAEE
jgi:hypothetical protein